MLKIFTYKCSSCGKVHDEFVETSDPNVDIQVNKCPDCGCESRKQFTATAMGGPRLKGKFNSSYPGR